jgi:hypothetical protein
VSLIRLPSEQDLWRFSLQVPIATKDFGVRPITPWGTQRVALRTILAGKEKGINQFLFVKARQVGLSTFMLILTLLWMQRFAGLQGVTITDSAENKEYFRDLFMGMMDELARRHDEAGEDTGPAATIEEKPLDPSKTRARNQVQIVWHNMSRLLLQTCGRQTWSRLGVGRGLSFTHGTEVPLWPHGGKAVTYLRSAWSEVNPASLYVLEGTARGKNWFYDLWMSAQKAKTMKAVFISWWLREDNRVRPRQKKLWAAYGNPGLTPKEREWDQLLRKRDKVVLDVEQWAWRRWYVAEKAAGSQRLADQEMPTVWEDAFSASMERPFLDRLTQERIDLSLCEPAAAYCYEWGNTMETTHPSPAGLKDPMLRVWTPPDTRPVVVSAVPAHSAMPDDPSWVVSVWSAALDEDKLEQSAEFHTESNIGLQAFAWVTLHLAGAYGAQHKTLILEVSGLGAGVLTEIQRLVRQGYGTTRTPGFLDVLGSVRHYIWRRPDSLTARGAYQWKSNAETQATVLQRFRDQIQRGAATVRSEWLAEELTRLEGAGDGFTPTGELPRGHRAQAGALAVESYVAQLYPTLKRYRERGMPATTVQGRTIQEFFGTLGRR